MKMLLTVKNPVNITRFMNENPFKGSMSANSISRVELGLIGDDGDDSFLGKMYDIQKMFRELVGVYWNNRTLVRRCSTPPVTPMKNAYVRFEPTMENVAKAIYLRMKPFLDAKLENSDLAFVMVITPMGKSIYYNEEMLADRALF